MDLLSKEATKDGDLLEDITLHTGDTVGEEHDTNSGRGTVHGQTGSNSEGRLSSVASEVGLSMVLRTIVALEFRHADGSVGNHLES